MSNNSDHSIEHHIQTYIRVFIALGVLTVITVAVSYLEVSFIEAFFLAITIASIKGSLVLGFFMHLISERAAIIWILVATTVAFIILMFIPLISSTSYVLTVLFLSSALQRSESSMFCTDMMQKSVGF